ncbi:MAG: hypothetical protein IPG96_18545 [Proteobacteria bacterium]|nr:hypothetical protein [Pseudomonadota bacterium]
MFARWQDVPTAAVPSWQGFFEGVAFAGGAAGGLGSQALVHAVRAQSAVDNLIAAYRRKGHRIARTDPGARGHRRRCRPR